MTFRPHSTRSGYLFLAAGLIFGAGALYLAPLLSQQSDLSRIFKFMIGLLFAVGLAGMAFYGAIIFFRLHYHLNRNGLVIQWGLGREHIPFNSIKGFILGDRIPAMKFVGLNLAGLRLGRGALADIGSIKFRTTTEPADSLLVVTPEHSYLISPRAPEKLIEAWQVRQRLGPTQNWSFEVRRSWPLNIPLLADPITWWLLGLAAITCLALFGYLSLQFPDLPAVLPIHFNTFGQADRIAEKSMLLLLPAAGALGLLLNGLLGCLLYRWEKMGAYLLWGSAVALQLFLWGAMLTLTGVRA